jgi:chaperone required for assembly of F1-ATPase
MIKTVYFSFAFKYIKAQVETDIEQSIISFHDEDLICYVFDNDVNEHQFFEAQNDFFELLDYVDVMNDEIFDDARRLLNVSKDLIDQLINRNMFEYSVYQMK